MQQLDEVLDVPANERLTAGDPNGPHAERGEDAHDAGDLLEGQQLRALEKRVVAAEDLLRHAVDAPEVAAVGDGDAKRLERPAQSVEQRLHNPMVPEFVGPVPVQTRDTATCSPPVRPRPE